MTSPTRPSSRLASLPLVPVLVCAALVGLAAVLLLPRLGLESPFGAPYETVTGPVAGNAGPSPLGPLANQLFLGEQAGVTGAMGPQGYRLSNPANERATVTVTTEIPDGTSRYRVTAEVSYLGPASADEGAGVVFALEPSSGDFAAVAIMGDGSVAILLGSEDKVRTVMSSRTEGLVRALNTITASVENGEASLQVNGQRIAGYGNDLIARYPAAGVLMRGRGDTTFRTFQLDAARSR